jgi:hypothetical protein
MNLLYKKRRKWRNILIHFGCDQIIVDDLISDMYLKVFEKMTKGTNIMYNKDEINIFIKSYEAFIMTKQGRIKIIIS